MQLWSDIIFVNLLFTDSNSLLQPEKEQQQQQQQKTQKGYFV